ncbi:MAG: hypothetical protein MMC33_001989 [Icmadophila ericetorum]|nr:hypothetical protein [Icmadophila ericetorum]
MPPQPNNLPPPFISIRKHIRRIPSPAEEPTSTLVLTSSKGHFVDIRVLKSAFSPTATETAIHPTCSPKVLDWAFCGTSTTTELGLPTASSPPADQSSGEECRHTVWTHWLDTASEEPESDEGDMYTLPDGDVLEKGFNPKDDGGREEYEELWGDEDARATGTEQEQDQEGDGKRVCVVLRMEGVEEDKVSGTVGRKGMIVRVGGWVQGILKEDGGFTVERWKWVEEKGEWENVVKLGMGEMPCGVTFNMHFTGEGAYKDLDAQLSDSASSKWTVLEAFQW